MGYKIYGEDEQKESLIGNFLFGLIFGPIVLYGGGLWALVSFGWVNPKAMQFICIVGGVLIGSWLAYESWLHNKKLKLKEGSL